MFDQTIEWIEQNREWFLSGMGATVLCGIGFFFIKLMAAKGGDWVSRLWKALGKSKERNRQELNEMNEIILGDPLDIARYYVEPGCQDRNPADEEEDDIFLSKNPIMDIIDRFLKPRHISRSGENQMFVLSDAGMGKTSLLTMLKLRHLTAFLPQKKDCVLKKLGKEILEELTAIENRSETILLLDSLDEDPEAHARVRERLTEILQATRHFFRVIITCRTQFFPDARKDPEVKNDSFERLGRISIGGFNCPVKYLSFFDDDMVDIYLAKRFPGRLFGLVTQREKEEKAGKVIRKMGALRCRPMLLAYIEELMDSPLMKEEEDNEYRVYDALVESWLEREKAKNPDINVENLRYACIILAVSMQIGKKRTISKDDLDVLIGRIAKVRPVKDIDLKGRSLLNHNSEGEYRFSHYSIQEFLVAKYVLERSELNLKVLEQPIPMTDIILKMISVSNKQPDSGLKLDCRGVENLNKIRLRNIKFPCTDFRNTDLSNADLSGCDLSNADFRGANITDTNLAVSCFDIGALKKVNTSGANLAGTRLIHSKLGMEFVYISPGEFMMGESEDRHKVILTKGVYMQTTPVTQKQWEAVMGDNPSCFKDGGEDCPVENVSWEDAQAFIKKLREMENTLSYRLPTNAQWEYACRAGTDTAWCFGDDERKLEEYAWYDKNSKGRTHPVGWLKPNAWGLYDMHGNVWEWCQDWFGDYPTGTVADLSGPSNGSSRVLRGGSWNSRTMDCRAANRVRSTPDERNRISGFRLISPLSQQTSDGF